MKNQRTAQRQKTKTLKTKKWKHHGEVRLNDDGSVDEIVIKNCDIHIEQMDVGSWWIGINAGPRRGKFGNRVDMMHVRLGTPPRFTAAIHVNCETDDGVICEGFK